MHKFIIKLGGKLVLLSAFAWPLQAMSGVVIPQPVYHFGEISSTSSVIYSCAVINHSACDVDISYLESSCDCLHILKYPQRLTAGSTNYVDIFLQPTMTGDVSYTVTMALSDTQFPACSLLLKGSVVSAESGLSSKDILAAYSSELMTRRVVSRDIPLYITPVEAMALCRNVEGCSIVDIRNVEDYENVHIPGSLQIPLFAISTKQYLRDRVVILADTYGLTPSLEEKCKQLTDSGFKSIRILYGGINAWKRAGGPLQGSPRAINALDFIGAEAFHSARRYADCLIINVSSNTAGMSQWLIPDALSTSALTNLLASIEASDKATHRMRTAILVADHGQLPSIDSSAYAPFTSVVVLDRGLSGYDEYLKTETAYRAHKTLTITSATKSAKASSRVLMPASIQKSCKSCRGH